MMPWRAAWLASALSRRHRVMLERGIRKAARSESGPLIDCGLPASRENDVEIGAQVRE